MRLIKYVGVKERKRDNLAGSGLVWEQGQVHEMNDWQAEVLLKFPEWEEVAAEAEEVAVEAEDIVTPRAPATSNVPRRRKKPK